MHSLCTAIGLEFFITALLYSAQNDGHPVVVERKLKTKQNLACSQPRYYQFLVMKQTLLTLLARNPQAASHSLGSLIWCSRSTHNSKVMVIPLRIDI